MGHSTSSLQIDQFKVLHFTDSRQIHSQEQLIDKFTHDNPLCMTSQQFDEQMPFGLRRV
jgi:hypothetical protein